MQFWGRAIQAQQIHQKHLQQPVKLYHLAAGMQLVFDSQEN